MPKLRPRPRLVRAACAALLLALAVQTALADEIVIERTLEAAPGYPRVHVQLLRHNEPITGRGAALGGLDALQGLGDMNDLDAMLDDLLAPQDQRVDSFPAFLDTGASGYVVSKSTAERFGLERVAGSRYHEVGLDGEIVLDVSEPYDTALADSTGRLRDTPGAFRHGERDVRLMLKRQPPANPLIEMTMGAIDVVGMPAIRHFVVELDPAPMGAGGGGIADMLGELQGADPLAGMNLLDHLDELGMGPAVTLHDRAHRPADVDLVIQMRYREYARRQNPRDRGPLPSLAAHPVLVDLTTRHDDAAFTGDWLLDTGAPVSIISTAHAAALGLYDDEGEPVGRPDFVMSLAGVGGDIRAIGGYRVDELRVPAAGGRELVYRGVHVLVTDISVTLDSGETVTLEGLFGTNLLLPTVAGLGVGLGLPTQVAPGPFERVWIDGPRGRLLLRLADR